MRLRDAIDLCTDTHSDDWVRIPGERPATAMVAGLFDPGAAEPELRPLVGHTIAVYEPDARLSLVWPVPDAEEPDPGVRRSLPEWAEQDDDQWKNARDAWAVVLLNGSPIWQARVWYLDWGSGIGGYVADFRPRFGDSEATASSIEGWEASAWAIGLARLLNGFSGASDFDSRDPTARIVPSPLQIHPIDAQRDG